MTNQFIIDWNCSLVPLLTSVSDPAMLAIWANGNDASIHLENGKFKSPFFKIDFKEAFSIFMYLLSLLMVSYKALSVD